MTSDTRQDIFMARVQILCFHCFYGIPHHYPVCVLFMSAFFKMELEVYVS